MMFTNRENEMSGLVSVLTGGEELFHRFWLLRNFFLFVEPTLFSYRTRGVTDICTITKEIFYDLMRIQPNLVLSIAAGKWEIVFIRLKAYLDVSDGSTGVSVSAADWFCSRMDVGRGWKSFISVWREKRTSSSAESSDCFFSLTK